MKTNNRNRYEQPEVKLVEVSPYGRLLTGSTTSNMNVSFGEEDLSREFDDFVFYEEDRL